MLIASVLVAALALLAHAAEPFKKLNIAADFINDNVHRSIDVSSQLVREKRAIALEVKKSGVAADYYFVVETLAQQPRNVTIAHVEAREKDASQAADVQFVAHERKDGRSLSLFKTRLASKVDRPVLVIDIVYTHALDPFPRQIAQDEKQLAVLYANAYLPSPYPTNKQRLKVQLFSSQTEEFSRLPQPVEKSGKTVTYGPYETQMPAYSFEPVRVHSENNAQFLTITRLQRELWLSHWGNNIATEEWYYVRHNGASLKGQFSRIDFSRQAMFQHKTGAITSLTLELPAKATEPYYRDDIGNVSTSNFRPELKRSVLELRPRYPLFGGWVYTWYMGYNLPLNDYVKVKDGRFYLEAPIVKTLENTPINDFTLKIVLPEGAQDIRVHLPYKMDLHQSTTKTYLDSAGRPTLYLNKRDMVDEHAQTFQVSYTMSHLWWVRKIVVTSLGFGVVYALAVLSSHFTQSTSGSAKTLKSQ